MVEGIGESLPRREDARFLTGQGTYVDNIHRRNGLHAVFVRSRVAAGRSLRVDVTRAGRAAGVVAAYTAEDLGLPDIPGNTGQGPPAADFRRPPLARGTVRYAGEALAVVVARTYASAVDAAALVDVTLEETPVVAHAEAALRDEQLLFPGAGTNVVHHDHVPAGVAPALDSWPVRVSLRVENQRLAPTPIEPLSIVADPTPEDGLTVWCGHQNPHMFRRQLSELVTPKPRTVRVIAPDIGGAFGMKGMLFPEYLVVAAAAMRLRQPVRWVATRQEELLSAVHGRSMHHVVDFSGTPDGRIQAALVRFVVDVGAYPHNGLQLALFATQMSSGAYAIEDFAVDATAVVTNRAPLGSYRGAGRPEANYAIERAMDAFARRLDLDPAAVRARNFVRRAQMPYRTVTDAEYDSGDYERALERALSLARVDDVRTEQARRLSTRENPLGIGIGAFVERSGGAKDSDEYARVEVTPAGGIVAYAGTSSSGQGHETVWSQIVASVLGVAPERITVITGDTALVPHGTGTYGSRSGQLAGSALQRTATLVAERVRSVAAAILAVDEDAVTQSNGRYGASDAATVGLAEIAAAAPGCGIVLSAEERFSAGAQTFPYGVYVAIVEVDVETGKVAVERLVAVDDCGLLLNPRIVEGQVRGSVLQGVSQALYEEFEYDDLAQPRTRTLADYILPSAPDAPHLVLDRLVTPAPSNPLGAKGTGEAGCIGAPSAVVNAVLDALAPWGVTDLQMPLTPERVWRALQEATPA